MPKLTIVALGCAVTSLALLAGCGSRYSTQEAYDICEDHRSRSGSSFTDESFADCVACYEDCGTECTPGSDFPLTYDCPE